MVLFPDKKLDLYIVPFFLFLVLALGDQGSLLRPLITYVFPFVLIISYLLSKRCFNISFSLSYKKLTSLKSVIVIYIVWVFIASILSGDVFNSLYYFSKLLIFFFLIYIIYKWLDSSSKYFMVLRMCYYSALIVACLIIMQFFLVEMHLINVESTRMGGVYSNVNSGGFIMAMLTLSCYLSYLIKRKSHYLWTILLCFLAVLVTGSRAALMVIIVAFTVTYFRSRIPKNIFFIILFSIIVILIVGSLYWNTIIQLLRVDNGTAGRVYLWIVAFQILKLYPLIGIGPGNLKEIGGSYLGELSSISEWERENLLEHAVQSSHNMYLEATVDTGLIGLMLFLIILLKVIKRYRAHIHSSDGLRRETSYLFLGIGIAVSVRGFFESNGFLCKGWLNMDIMFWIFFILYSKIALILNRKYV